MVEQSLAIVGGGGHAVVVYEAALAAGFDVAGFFDDKPAPGLEPFTRHLGPISEAPGTSHELVLGLGGLGARRHFIDTLRVAAWVTVVHPCAIVSSSASIGAGTFIGAGVIVNARAHIAPHAILNTACVIEHDCEVGENVHVAPRAVLGGAASVGADTLIGIGATVLPGVKVGRRCVVSGGGAAAHDIPDRTTAIGVPARPARGA